MATITLLSGCSLIEQAGGLRAAGQAEGAGNGVPNPEAPPVPPAPARVVMLLNPDIESHASIADQVLRTSAGLEIRRVELSGNELPAATIREIEAFEPDKILAIGLAAALAGRQFEGKPLVFCQVFNYGQHRLLSSKSKGVKLLPPFDLQLDAWREIDPALKAVGLIVGSGHDELVVEAQRAATRHGMRLAVQTVGSDKEMLYAFKRLTPQIQGFWLLPDNRILSPAVLREILVYARKHGIRTAAFNPQLLELGADISFTSTDADVASAVLKVLGGAGAKDLLFGPPMTSLSEVRTDVNPRMAPRRQAQADAGDGRRGDSY